MRLIGINGFKTAGKDTVFNFIRQALPDKRVERVAFADKLKIMAARALGFNRPDAELIALMDSLKEGSMLSVLYDEPDNPSTPWEDKSELKHLSGREYLQFFGAGAREVFDRNFWIDQVLPSGQTVYPDDVLCRRYPGVDILCVTDVRYPNEAERIRQLRGEVWEVIRPGLTSDGHSSEQPLPRVAIDRTIINNGSLEDLQESIRSIIKEEICYA